MLGRTCMDRKVTEHAPRATASVLHQGADSARGVRPCAWRAPIGDDEVDRGIVPPGSGIFF
jgi:hypothetical protein